MQDARKRKCPRWLAGLIVLLGVCLGLLSILNAAGADRWWLGALNLYLPQVLWLLPVLLLAIPVIWRARRWSWVLAIYVLWICGPIMGFRWNMGRKSDPGEGRPRFRVMTCNTKYGQRNLAVLAEDISRYGPDVVLLQDVNDLEAGGLSTVFRGWNIRSYNEFVIASRFPLSEAEIHWISFGEEPEPCMRVVVSVGEARVALYNVHFMTPRFGLKALKKASGRKPSRWSEAIQGLEENVQFRLAQAGSVAGFVRQETGAVVVAGDLNSPRESMVCKRLEAAGLRNAFAEGGRGYGHTYGHFLLRRRYPWLKDFSWMRIDHILVGGGVRSQKCWTGTGEASDHRPVFADLVLEAR
jgi:vancomycin resistance protein VanJ